MWTKFYDIRKTDKYIDARSVYDLLPVDYEYKLKPLIGEDIYHAILFDKNVLSPIESYCEKFYDCHEKGMKYELGLYFQKRKYEHEGFITSDIRKFSSLLKVYNKETFPEEYNLIAELVKDLNKFLRNWKTYEKIYPELFTSEIN